MPPNGGRIHILLKCMWNILQDRSHVRPQSSLRKFLKIKIIQSVFSKQNGMSLEINNKRKTTNKYMEITNMWKLTHSLKTNGSKKTSQEKS